VVPISHSQRRPLPRAHWARTVHHGLPERLVPKPIKPSYFAFLGRIAPENGIDRAIRRRRITCRYTESGLRAYGANPP
jgi:hypothetical protein